MNRIRSKAPGTLPVRIPETIFFDGDGRPASLYFYSEPEARVVVKQVPDEDLLSIVALPGEWAPASESPDTDGSDPRPVAVARYRTGGRTLTARELRRMMAVVEARFASPLASNASNDADASGGKVPPLLGRPTTPAIAIPLVLQRYVPPAEGARHVTTFMMAETSVMCETFQCAYHAAYTPRHTASGSVDSAELWELGDGPGPERSLLSASMRLAAGARHPGVPIDEETGVGGEAGGTSQPAGIQWAPAAPPAKEVYLRQTVLKMVNGVRRDLGVQILGVIAELILPTQTRSVDAGDAGERAEDEPPTVPAPTPVLTGAFGVCWPDRGVQASVGAAVGPSRPFYTALPVPSATVSSDIPGETPERRTAPVPTRPAAFLDGTDAGSSSVKASASVSVSSATAAGSGGVATPARRVNNPTPQPRPVTAPEVGARRAAGVARGGGAGAGVGARRRFEAEYVATRRVTSTAPLVGGSGSFSAYANNDPGTSSFRSPSTGRQPPSSRRYGIHSPAAQVLARSTGGSSARRAQRPGTSGGELFS